MSEEKKQKPKIRLPSVGQAKAQHPSIRGDFDIYHQCSKAATVAEREAIVVEVYEAEGIPMDLSMPNAPSKRIGGCKRRLEAALTAGDPVVIDLFKQAGLLPAEVDEQGGNHE